MREKKMTERKIGGAGEFVFADGSLSKCYTTERYL